MTTVSMDGSDLCCTIAQHDESSRDDKMTASIDAVIDSFFELLEHNLVEIDLEHPPAGMMCPIRGICPDRGWKNQRSITRING